MKICPEHKLMLAYSVEKLGYACTWPGCTYWENDGSNQFTGASNPFEQAFKEIKFETTQRGDKVEMKVDLPPLFNMPNYTRIFFESEAPEGVSRDEWFDYQRAAMLKDDAKRFSTKNKNGDNMNVTVYIRKENEDAWNNLADRSQWLNFQLSQLNAVDPKPVASIPSAFNLGVCKKHGTPLTLEGKCLQKGH